MGKRRNSNRDQPRYSTAERIIYSCLGIFYISAFIYVLFFTQNRWRYFPKRNFNLILFRDKLQHWQTRTLHTRPENVELYKDIIGNILLFIPFPFFLFFFFRVKTFSRLLFISIAASFLIEALQYLMNVGVADVDDLVLNTIGSLLGILLLATIRNFKRNNHQQPADHWQVADEL